MLLAVNFSVLLVLLIISGFFSCSETALFSLSRIERKRLFETKPKAAKSVRQLLETPGKTLLTILIGNQTVNTLAAAIVSVTALEYLKPEISGAVMLAFTVILIFFGEIVPKVIAVRNHVSLSARTSWPLCLAVWVLSPVRILVKTVTDRILALLIRDKKTASETLSEEELSTLVKMGEEDGVLEAREGQMIQKLFELGQRPVKDIMTPRIDVLALDVDDSFQQHEAILRKGHFSYIPVYQQSIDHILGVVSVQEYLLKRERLPLKSLLRDPLYIPETKRIDEVLDEFKRREISFAVCIDEHGGTDGIVTQEDILEEIFGEYYDEYETPANPIRRFGREEYLVEAKISLVDFNDYFDSRLKSAKASTLGGFILENLGEVPTQGKVLEVEGFRIRIEHMIRHRIHQVTVRGIA